MVGPINSQLSLMQLQAILEMLHSAQREHAIDQERKELDTAKTKLRDQVTITKQEEAQHKSIRDDDPRKGRDRRNPRDETPRDEEDEPPRRIDIRI